MDDTTNTAQSEDKETDAKSTPGSLLLVIFGLALAFAMSNPVWGMAGIFFFLLLDFTVDEAAKRIARAIRSLKDD